MIVVLRRCRARLIALSIVATLCDYYEETTAFLLDPHGMGDFRLGTNGAGGSSLGRGGQTGEITGDGLALGRAQ